MHKQGLKEERRVFYVRANGEAVQESWVKDCSAFCNRCGNQGIWKKDNGYNKLLANLCTKCGNYFTIADISTQGEFHKIEQRVRFIDGCD